MNARDINRVAPLLHGLIHNAIISSVQFVVAKCRTIRNRPQEPDFIASLTINFSKDLFNILKAVFPKNKFSVTGVFCHQKPLADIGMSKDPEVGDWLLVYIYTDKRGAKKFNSLLLQAKISTKQTVAIAATDQHQLKLYTDWPAFTYKRAGSLNGTRRDILPKTINDGAQYLLIDDNPITGLSGSPGTFPMGCATPAKTLSLNNDLTSEFVDFLKFKSGRAFEENPNTTNDDWTKMIWDLLHVSKGKASRRRNAGLPNFPRQSTNSFDGLCYFATDLTSIFSDLHRELGNGDIKDNAENYFDEENFSPSILLIESNEQENEE